MCACGCSPPMVRRMACRSPTSSVRTRRSTSPSCCWSCGHPINSGSRSRYVPRGSIGGSSESFVGYSIAAVDGSSARDLGLELPRAWPRRMVAGRRRHRRRRCVRAGHRRGRSRRHDRRAYLRPPRVRSSPDDAGRRSSYGVGFMSHHTVCPAGRRALLGHRWAARSPGAPRLHRQSAVDARPGRGSGRRRLHGRAAAAARARHVGGGHGDDSLGGLGERGGSRVRSTSPHDASGSW